VIFLRAIAWFVLVGCCCTYIEWNKMEFLQTITRLTRISIPGRPAKRWKCEFDLNLKPEQTNRRKPWSWYWLIISYILNLLIFLWVYLYKESLWMYIRRNQHQIYNLTVAVCDVIQVEVIWVLTSFSVLVRCQRFRGPCPEDGGSMDLWNFDILPQHDTASEPRRPRLESSPPTLMCWCTCLYAVSRSYWVAMFSVT